MPKRRGSVEHDAGDQRVAQPFVDLDERSEQILVVRDEVREIYAR